MGVCKVKSENGFKIGILIAFVFLFGITIRDSEAARLVGVSILDQDYLIVNISDGDVVHEDELNKVERVLRYIPELSTAASVQPASWTITSLEDTNYGTDGRNPLHCSRKKKLSGHAEMEWSGNDFHYEYTYEHWIYLQLPRSLQQGMTYQLSISSLVNSDIENVSITFDQFSSISEAIHVNLVGYNPDAPHKAADLYYWMGSGGARNYSAFEGNAVYLLNVETGASSQVGVVEFWKSSSVDVHNYNLTGSDVWNIDFSVASEPGTYRLVVEGIGSSQEFLIADHVYKDPFSVSLLGYFYMRIGETNPRNISPPPRTPLYIPGQDPASTTVYLTSMHPFHAEWDTFVSGDKWDNPNAWISYVKSGPNNTNLNGWGGHSDAADWDRHLGHVINIWDMLLPYLMSNGNIDDDDLGITESGNGIPDIIDEARNEVDFWLRLRDGDGYSHGLTNPNDNHELFQAAPTALAAWANAANAAMLADTFRVAGLTSLVSEYRDAAIEAYNHASSLSDQMLDDYLYFDEGHLKGRDLKMMAAAFIYNITGNTIYEDVINAESVCANGPSVIQYFYGGDNGRNQLYGTAAYLITSQEVHYPSLYSNMKTQIISEAKSSEANLMNSRPSRRTTYNPPSYWRTAHFVGRTIVAHAVADTPEDRSFFRKALNLEADWGLGRNPLNMIEMTTATTSLETKRSVMEAYTSGRHDGTPGVHPGHTPYMNLSDWWQGMTMAMPSRLYENSFPGDVVNTWPIGETYFPSRWVFSHTEFTPRQTMKGKVALYGYLYSLAENSVPLNPALSVSVEGVAGGTGSVTSSPGGIDCGGDCFENYTNGETVTLIAMADSGFVFNGWSGSCFGIDETCQVDMNMDRSVTAHFKPVGLTYELNVTHDGTGDGSVVSIPVGIDCGINCSAEFSSGTRAALTAVPQPGSAFSGWNGSCSGTGDCELVMSSDKAVISTFMSSVSPELILYSDTLVSGWNDWSWTGTVDFAGTSPVYEGTHGINITLGGWGGFSLGTTSEEFDTQGYSGVSFLIHGGDTTKKFEFHTEGSDGASTDVPVTATAGAWTEINISFEQLGNPGSISRLVLFNGSEDGMSMFTVDDIRVVSSPADPTGGDVNSDGSVDLTDAIGALKVLVNRPTAAVKNADVNGNDRIGIEEAVYILQTVSNPLE